MSLDTAIIVSLALLSNVVVTLGSFVVILTLLNRRTSMLEFDNLKAQVDATVAAESQAAVYLSSGVVDPAQVEELRAKLAESEVALRAAFPAPPQP